MIAEKLARASLRADAIYCLGLGGLLFSQRQRLSELTAYPPDVLAGAGTGTAVWGVAVAAMAGAEDWSRPTKLVSAGNAVAVVVLSWFGSQRGGRARRWVMGMAATVGAFGVSQAVALALRRD